MGVVGVGGRSEKGGGGKKSGFSGSSTAAVSSTSALPLTANNNNNRHVSKGRIGGVVGSSSSSGSSGSSSGSGSSSSSSSGNSSSSGEDSDSSSSSDESDSSASASSKPASKGTTNKDAAKQKGKAVKRSGGGGGRSRSVSASSGSGSGSGSGSRASSVASSVASSRSSRRSRSAATKSVPPAASSAAPKKCSGSAALKKSAVAAQEPPPKDKAQLHQPLKKKQTLAQSSSSAVAVAAAKNRAPTKPHPNPSKKGVAKKTPPPGKSAKVVKSGQVTNKKPIPPPTPLGVGVSKKKGAAVRLPPSSGGKVPPGVVPGKPLPDNCKGQKKLTTPPGGGKKKGESPAVGGRKGGKREVGGKGARSKRGEASSASAPTAVTSTTPTPPTHKDLGVGGVSTRSRSSSASLSSCSSGGGSSSGDDEASLPKTPLKGKKRGRGEGSRKQQTGSATGGGVKKGPSGPSPSKGSGRKKTELGGSKSGAVRNLSAELSSNSADEESGGEHKDKDKKKSIGGGSGGGVEPGGGSSPKKSQGRPVTRRQKSGAKKTIPTTTVFNQSLLLGGSGSSGSPSTPKKSGSGGGGGVGSSLLGLAVGGEGGELSLAAGLANLPGASTIISRRSTSSSANSSESENPSSPRKRTVFSVSCMRSGGVVGGRGGGSGSKFISTWESDFSDDAYSQQLSQTAANFIRVPAKTSSRPRPIDFSQGLVDCESYEPARCPFPSCDSSGHLSGKYPAHNFLSCCPKYHGFEIDECKENEKERGRREAERSRFRNILSTPGKKPPKVTQETRAWMQRVKELKGEVGAEGLVSHYDQLLWKDALAIAADRVEREQSDGINAQGIYHRLSMAVAMGRFEMKCWCASPYPEPLSQNRRLFVCEFCLKPVGSGTILRRHCAKCVWRHPPGDEIYRKERLSVWEVDGKKQKSYCQNLCLLAKCFLDHKTLYLDVDPFLFYVMTLADSQGCHLVGYFSKEKNSFLNYNVSCILTLPPYMRQGFGRLLIDFSYLLTRVEGKVGSPEKPLSDLGLISYRSYWKDAVLRRLCACASREINIKDLSIELGVSTADLISTLQYLGMLKYWKGKHLVLKKQDVLEDYLDRVRRRGNEQRQIDSSCLRWRPFQSPPEEISSPEKT